MYQQRIEQLKKDMETAVTAFTDELKTLRTGRASTALVEDVMVAYYGTQSPLKHVASISVPDPRLIIVSPWDKSMLTEIENALRFSDVGLNPVNDGTHIRLAIPPMTEERRRELSKKLHKMAEEVKVALRTLRRDVWDEIQDMERAGKISEDDRYDAEKLLNELIEKENKKIDGLVAAKEKEIMTI